MIENNLVKTNDNNEKLLFDNILIIYNYYIETNDIKLSRILNLYIEDYEIFYNLTKENNNFYNSYIRNLKQIIYNYNLKFDKIYQYNIRESALEGSIDYSSIIVNNLIKLKKNI
jgi:hypothetical protein